MALNLYLWPRFNVIAMYFYFETKATQQPTSESLNAVLCGCPRGALGLTTLNASPSLHRALLLKIHFYTTSLWSFIFSTSSLPLR